jgi:hypothetical protein
MFKILEKVRDKYGIDKLDPAKDPYKQRVRQDMEQDPPIDWHAVRQDLEDYIRVIGNLDYPHRRTKHHRYEGVEFRAKHKTTKFYNKERECSMAEAHGILRQEITLLKGKDIQRLLGNKQPTLLDVTREIVTEQLEEELVKLGLLGNSIATHDTALEKLSRAHGNLAGPYYYGPLAALRRVYPSSLRLCRRGRIVMRPYIVPRLRFATCGIFDGYAANG